MSEELAKNGGGPAALRTDKDMGPDGGKFRGGKRRKKVSFLTINKIATVDYKDTVVLKRFLNDRGKILASRQTGNTAKQQRMISTAIRRARELALLPFVVVEMTAERREYAPRRAPRDYHQADQTATAPTAAPAAE